MRIRLLPLKLPPKTSFFYDPKYSMIDSMAKDILDKPNSLFSHKMDADADSNGVVDDFTVAAGAGITYTKSLNDSAQKIEITASTTTNLAYVAQSIPIQAGHIISIQFDYKVDGNVQAGLTMDWYNGGAFISSTAEVNGASTSYTGIRSINLTAPANTTKVNINIGVRPLANGNVGSVWIRNGLAIVDRANVSTVPDGKPRIILPGASPTLNHYGLTFAGASSQYLYADNNSNFDQADISPGNPFTIFTVIKLDSIAASQYIINKNVSTANDRQYVLILDDAVGGKIKGVLENANAGTGNLYTRILNTTEWFAVIFSADSSFATYITNGKLDNRTANTVKKLTPRPYFRIGCRSNALDGSTGTSFLYGTLGFIGICRSDPWVVMRWMKKYCYGRWPIRWER